MVILAEDPSKTPAHPKGCFVRHFLCVSLLFLLPAQVLKAEEKTPTLHESWDYAARLLINDSYALFNKLKPANAQDQRSIDFGKAATLISVQPKTSDNIVEADELLQKMVKENGSDEAGISAMYLLARIAQVHSIPPNEALAVERYTTLIQSHPEHVLGQAAMTKRAMLRIYAESAEPSFESRYQLAVKEVPLVTEIGARRDYMILLANTSIRLKKPAQETLGFLLEAEKCNNFRQRALGDLYVRIAEFSVEAGKKDQAIAYYQKFLDQFLRDNRRYIVKEKLAALQTKGAKP